MTVVKDPTKQRPQAVLKHTQSTHLQAATEAECSPFFVDLTQLPASQLDHLRDTGLLTRTTQNNEQHASLDICLLRDRHVQYLQTLWTDHRRPQLRSSFVSLDSSRTWMLYWSLHACDLLGYSSIKEQDAMAIVKTIERCFTRTVVELPKAAVVNVDPLLRDECPRRVANKTDAAKDNTVCFQAGGFGGGPGQMAHAATTYAAVLTLCILANHHHHCTKTDTADKDTSDDTTTSSSASAASAAALTLLDQIRLQLYPWMVSLYNLENGSLRMQHDGEVDVRATYCLVAVARLLHIIPDNSILRHRAAAFVASCQTWEGGFGAEPYYSEAHGGYTFCALAALQLLGQTDLADLSQAAAYLSKRQMSLEGGFSGRSNKLVDGCYSFWQGGAMAIVSALLLGQPQREQSTTDDNGASTADATSTKPSAAAAAFDNNDPWLSSQPPTELLFDQAMLERYILLCAQEVNGGLRDKPSKNRDHYHSCYNLSGLSVAQHYSNQDDDESSSREQHHFGHPTLSQVARTHPCYNIRVEHVRFILDHFSQQHDSK